MKPAKILCLSLVVLSLLFSGGCKASAPAESPQAGTVSEAPETPASGTDLPPAETSAPIAPASELSVAYADEALLSAYASYHEFTAPEDENAPKLLLTANTVLKDFRFIAIGYELEGDKVLFHEKEVLYEIEEFLPEKPLMVGVNFPGILPERGVAFTDENQETRYFYLAMSGEDGSVFLTEF